MKQILAMLRVRFQQNNAIEGRNQFQEIGVRSKIYSLKCVEISMKYGLWSKYKVLFLGFIDPNN